MTSLIVFTILAMTSPPSAPDKLSVRFWGGLETMPKEAAILNQKTGVIQLPGYAPHSDRSGLNELWGKLNEHQFFNLNQQKLDRYVLKAGGPAKYLEGGIGNARIEWSIEGRSRSLQLSAWNTYPEGTDAFGKVITSILIIHTLISKSK